MPPSLALLMTWANSATRLGGICVSIWHTQAQGEREQASKQTVSSRKHTCRKKSGSCADKQKPTRNRFAVAMLTIDCGAHIRHDSVPGGHHARYSNAHFFRVLQLGGHWDRRELVLAVVLLYTRLFFYCARKKKRFPLSGRARPIYVQAKSSARLRLEEDSRANLRGRQVLSRPAYLRPHELLLMLSRLPTGFCLSLLSMIGCQPTDSRGRCARKKLHNERTTQSTTQYLVLL